MEENEKLRIKNQKSARLSARFSAQNSALPEKINRYRDSNVSSVEL